MPWIFTKKYSSSPRVPMVIWRSGGKSGTCRFRGLVLNHLVLKGSKPKHLSKRAKFDQKQQFLSVFSSSFFKYWWLSTKPMNLGSAVTSGTPNTHGYPWGDGIVFSKNLRQLVFVFVNSIHFYFFILDSPLLQNFKET